MSPPINDNANVKFVLLLVVIGYLRDRWWRAVILTNTYQSFVYYTDQPLVTR